MSVPQSRFLDIAGPRKEGEHSLQSHELDEPQILHPHPCLSLSLGVYVATAAQPALLDDADASHALVSREMLQRGDWVVMYQDGIRYLEKAPLHYWMVAVSYKFFGQGAFQTRLPLVLSVAGLVLMVYFFARRFFGETAAFYSGLIICTSVGTWLFTRVMVPEAIFALPS